MPLTSIVPRDGLDLESFRGRVRDARARFADVDRRQIVAACSPRRLWAAVDPPLQLRRLRTSARQLLRPWPRSAPGHLAVRHHRARRDTVTRGGITPSDTVSVVRSSLVLSWAAVSSRVGTPRSPGRLR